MIFTILMENFILDSAYFIVYLDSRPNKAGIFKKRHFVMFSLHMYIRVGQNFKTAILMEQMKANVLVSREQVEKTVSCIPFFELWTLKICQSCNFVVFGQIVLKFGTQII